MVQRRLLWVVTLVGVTLVSLAGQVAVVADPVAPDRPSGYALGVYAPEDRVGHLSFPDAAPPAALLAAPASDYGEEVVRLINLERRAADFPPFKVSSSLSTSAEEHSAVMRDQGCFDHQCSGELPSLERACHAGYGPYGWGDCYVGETIGAGFQDPASIVAAWLASPGHQRILMDGKLREIGVGYVSGGTYGHYWTADFGSQPDVLPVFINYDDPEADGREVTLTLTNEEVSGWGGVDYAHEVMISNDPNFAGAQWEPYTRHKSWTLADGTGPKTVYVRYRDSTGYEVTSSDDIRLSGLEYDLELSTNSLVFMYRVGSGFGSSTTERIGVDNAAGSDPMTWNVTGTEPWIGFAPGGGTTPGELLISVDGFETTTLGVRQATITVSSLQIPGETEAVTVTIQAVGDVYRVMLPWVVRARR